MMNKEYRIAQLAREGGNPIYYAQMRYTAPDEQLRAEGIMPGWHNFKSSISREVCDKAVDLAELEDAIG